MGFFSKQRQGGTGARSLRRGNDTCMRATHSHIAPRTARGNAFGHGGPDRLNLPAQPLPRAARPLAASESIGSAPFVSPEALSAAYSRALEVVPRRFATTRPVRSEVRPSHWKSVPLPCAEVSAQGAVENACLGKGRCEARRQTLSESVCRAQSDTWSKTESVWRRAKASEARARKPDQAQADGRQPPAHHPCGLRQVNVLRTVVHW